MVGILLCACEPSEPEQGVAMPLSICLPAGEVYATQAPERRAFGDPGTTEQFALPTHLYIFIVKEESADNWKVWEIIEETPSDGDWKKTHYVGGYATYGDSIFEYKSNVNLLLKSDGFNGRVYVVASAVALTFDQTITKGTSTLENLLGLTFSFNAGSPNEADSVSIRANLQNIYSTPFNYNNDKGDYYGSFYALQNVPHLNLLLYHVAAKVDLMWNVAESKRDDVKISYIAAEHLYDEDCYLFKPNQNAPDVSGTYGRYASGYKRAVVSNLSVGTQWNGRAYFYTIPYRNSSNKFPLQLQMLKNDDIPKKTDEPLTYRTDAEYYHLVQATDMPTDAIFMPWVRCQININKAFDYSATRDVFPKP